MTKLVPMLLVAVALVAGGIAAAQLTAGNDPEPRLSLASASVPGTTTVETTGTTTTETTAVDTTTAASHGRGRERPVRRGRARERPALHRRGDHDHAR